MSLIKTESSTPLWDNISSLPDELKAIIGNYSRSAHMEKILIRLQYFKRWAKENLDRIFEAVQKWTKKQVYWTLMKLKVYNHSHVVMNKQTLIETLRKKFHQAICGCICAKHTKITWQRLKAVEIVNGVFNERKRLVLKQRRVDKKAKAVCSVVSV